MRILLAVASIVVGSFALGAPAVAVASENTGNACLSRFVCFYANSGFGPTSAILNIDSNETNWANIGGAPDACGGITSHVWNDCASSIKSMFATNTMWVWSDSSCVGSMLQVLAGETFSNLGNNNFNDIISADSVNQQSC
ncbi:MAG TPA: hypothetical protein VFQ44_05310 [Streptosporangiaceae bacterium]|nr:hypothetical protein [Streptosporangiaceae bacterium]